MFYVWLPMFPRPSERRALPDVAREFGSGRVRQYWDGAKVVGRVFKERVVPDFRGNVAWDVWVLFDEGATWDSAGDHVVGWGFTVAATRERLFARLEALEDR